MYASSAKNYRRMVVNIDYYYVITTIQSRKSHNPVQSLIWKKCPVLGYLLFFTLGVVNSFTLWVISLSLCLVDLLQLGRIKNRVIQTASHIFCYLVWPQNLLGPSSEPRFWFQFSFTENRGFGFKTSQP